MEYYYSPSQYYPSYLDLLVNETSYDWLGTTDGVTFTPHTYSPSHVYRINIIGTGDVATFRINDSAYHDNSGALQVEISVVPVPSAVILGGLGLTFSGWLLMKKRALRIAKSTWC